LSNSKLPFLICGDININLLQQDTVLSVSNYVKTYNSYNCLELITKPTRITTTSSTLIDHIYTNLPATKLTPGILINDLSDHLPVFVSVKSNISKKSLGPLLFALYINDLPSATKLTPTLFADDTVLSISGSNSTELQSTVNTELEKVNEWLHFNKLSLNYSKTSYMIVSRQK